VQVSHDDQQNRQNRGRFRGRRFISAMKPHLKPVADQVIVILGASSPTGLATAKLAVSQGARLVLAAHTERSLAQLVEQLGPMAGQVIAVPTDVTSEDDVRRVADEAKRVFGGFDTWVNNAALSAYGACLEVPLPDMRRIMETNFWGLVHGSRVACSHLRRDGGALINMGSVVSDRAIPLQGIYSASKQAIKTWTDSLRAELEDQAAPVSVTLIKPGAIGAPEEHAKAILHAAEFPTREMVVGGAGKLLWLSLKAFTFDRRAQPTTSRPRVA
jgi:short-subunit dehydrogenase